MFDLCAICTGSHSVRASDKNSTFFLLVQKKKHECFTYAQHPVDPILFARQTAAFPAAFSKTKNLKSQCPSKFLSKKAIIETTQ